MHFFDTSFADVSPFQFVLFSSLFACVYVRALALAGMLCVSFMKSFAGGSLTEEKSLFFLSTFFFLPIFPSLRRVGINIQFFFNYNFRYISSYFPLLLLLLLFLHALFRLPEKNMNKNKSLLKRAFSPRLGRLSRGARLFMLLTTGPRRSSPMLFFSCFF